MKYWKIIVVSKSAWNNNNPLFSLHFLGNGKFQRFISGPLRRLFSFFERLGFIVDHIEDGSLVLYLRATTESSWEELKHKCESREIFELLYTLDIDDEKRKACFVEGDCIKITIYSVKDKSGKFVYHSVSYSFMQLRLIGLCCHAL